MKKRMMLLLIAAVLAAGTLFSLALNLVMNGYIDKQARRALESEVLAIPTEETGYDAKSPLFNVTSFSVNPGKRSEDRGFFSPDEIRISRYLDSHRDFPAPGAIEKIKIDGYLYYFTWENYPFEEDGELEDEGEELAQGSNEGQKPKMESWFFFINASYAFSLVETLNLISAGVLALLAVLAAVAGVRVGSALENAEQKMKRFFANASHELKTPLMSIQGYAEGLQTGIIKDVRGGAQIILNQSDRMSALIEELLFMSRLESGERRMSLLPAPLNDLADDCVSGMQALALQKGIALEADYPEPSPLVLCDRRALEKGINNLLSNALRHAKSLVRLSVSVKEGQAILRVEDDGKGIAPPDLPHIFERFYTGEGGGSGIGLSLAREITLLHHGELSCRNGERGAVFTLKLKRYMGRMGG